MGLVDYPDSDEEPTTGASSIGIIQGSTDTTKDGKKNPPPLPSSFHNLYSTATRTSTSDDPSLHGGRKRLTPHIEGHWPTHVYIEWIPKPEEATALAGLLETYQHQSVRDKAIPGDASFFHSLLQNELGVPLPLHISLSRSLSLQTAQRDGFRAALQARIRSSGVKSFDVSFKNIKQVSNFEDTRSFLVLGLERPLGNELNRLLEACNMTCSGFGFSELYASKDFAISSDRTVADASEAFHFSIAWSLPTSSARPSSVASKTASTKVFEAVKSGIIVACCTVKLKMGNEVFDITLNH